MSFPAMSFFSAMSPANAAKINNHTNGDLAVEYNTFHTLLKRIYAAKATGCIFKHAILNHTATRSVRLALKKKPAL
jgi:hypothetical protein